MPPRSLIFLLGRFALAAALAGGAAGAAQAQDVAPDNPLHTALRKLGFVPPQPAQTPDFVRRTRPAEPDLHYVPLGSARPEPSDKPLTREQILAEEAKLSALRDQTARRAGRKPTIVVARSAAGPLIPAKVKAAPKPCRMTCKIDLTKIGQRSSMQ